MEFTIKSFLSYLWLLFAIACYILSYILGQYDYYRDIAVHLFLTTTLYLSLMERPSDVESFKNIEPKGLWSYLVIRTHWERRISLFSFIMQILIIILIVSVFIEFTTIYIYTKGGIEVSEVVFSSLNKSYFIVSLVLFVFIAGFKIIRDYRVE